METINKALCESTRGVCSCLKRSKILDEILIEPHYKDYTRVILGKNGPTGKTWLWNQMKSKGFNVIEISEPLLRLVNYTDDRNHVLVNDFHKVILIALNHSLR